MIITPEGQKILEVAQRLDPLHQEIIFVGGAAIGFLITDPATDQLRPTKDVDAVVHATTRIQYEEFTQQIQAKGFHLRIDEPVTCRFFYGDLFILDLIPTSQEALGFSNPWLTLAAQSDLTKTIQPLPEFPAIKIIDAPAFLASKLQAFIDRGKSDLYESHDLEDIINLTNGRPELIEETTTSNPGLQHFVRQTLTGLLQNRAFPDAVEGHLASSGESADRAKLVLDRLKSIARP